MALDYLTEITLFAVKFLIFYWSGKNDKNILQFTADFTFSLKVSSWKFQHRSSCTSLRVVSSFRGTRDCSSTTSLSTSFTAHKERRAWSLLLRSHFIGRRRLLKVAYGKPEINTIVVFPVWHSIVKRASCPAFHKFRNLVVKLSSSTPGIPAVDFLQVIT